jgi:phosphorylcholine metabolism protein LicD
MTTPIQVLNKTCQILDLVGAEYWLCNGTLLGIIRDKSLIPWDTDLDIAIFEEALKDRIVEELTLEGYVLIDDGHGSSYVTFTFKDQKVDINFFEIHHENLQSLWKVNRLTGISGLLTKIIAKLGFNIPRLNFLWELEGYSVPYEAIFPISKIDIRGAQYRVPRDSEHVLAHTYGASWKTPKRDYNWRLEGVNNAKG